MPGLHGVRWRDDPWLFSSKRFWENGRNLIKALPNIRLDGLRKTTKTLSQDSQLLLPNTNPEHHRYINLLSQLNYIYIMIYLTLFSWDVKNLFRASELLWRILSPSKLT
jgi:hypothetical protein